MDVQLMVMVIVVNWSIKFVVCALLMEKAEFSELSCPHSRFCSAHIADKQSLYSTSRIELDASIESLDTMLSNPPVK